MKNKIRIGLFGYGHLGKIHLKCLKNTPFKIVGIFDPALSESDVLALKMPFFPDEDSLMNACDAVDIVSPTTTHKQLVIKAIAKGKHIFVEKPIVSTLEELESIKGLMSKSLVLQVGHVERFNPAFIPLKEQELNPMFIEGHRIATFNPRGTDVSVVLDLMIHDLDIIAALVDSEVESISASGVSIVSENPDIANARIVFNNGCVANLTASRISMKQMRKIRIFARSAYVSVDFLEKTLSIIRLNDEQANKAIQEGYEIDTHKGKKYVTVEEPELSTNNAIEDELNAFYLSISEGKPVEASIDAAYRSMKMAYEIMNQINLQEEKYKDYLP